MSRVRIDREDRESNPNGSAIEWLLIVKLAAPILELNDRWWHAQNTDSAGGKSEAPLVGLGVVETQGEKLKVTCGAIGLEFGQIGAAIPHLVDN